MAQYLEPGYDRAAAAIIKVACVALIFVGLVVARHRGVFLMLLKGHRPECLVDHHPQDLGLLLGQPGHKRSSSLSLIIGLGQDENHRNLVGFGVWRHPFAARLDVFVRDDAQGQPPSMARKCSRFGSMEASYAFRLEKSRFQRWAISSSDSAQRRVE